MPRQCSINPCPSISDRTAVIKYVANEVVIQTYGKKADDILGKPQELFPVKKIEFLFLMIFDIILHIMKNYER
jgi:hypothetical protein